MTDPAPVLAQPVNPQSWLLRMTRTRWNYALSFVADASVVVVSLTWAALTHESGDRVLPVVLSALVGYTLYEYLLHRFAFHGSRAPRVVREGHGSHHRDPDARLAMPFFASLLQGAVCLALSIAVLGPSLGALFTGICALGYLTYGTVHHLVHTPAVRVPPVPWLRAAHEVHHARPRRNYGVSTPLWDFVFRTFTPPS